MAGKVLLMTGAAPYLGGPATWTPLRTAAPEFDFVDYDTLEMATFATYDEMVRDVCVAMRDVRAVVAHATAARILCDVVARTPETPVVLLSPLVVLHETPFVKVARFVFARSAFAALLDGFARSKLGRLETDRDLVARQLHHFIRDERIVHDLVDEAMARIRDPRCRRIVDRTTEFLRYSPAPLDADLDRLLPHRRVLVGTDLAAKRIAKSIPVTVVPGVLGAPMLEAPRAVANALRELLSAG